MVEWISDWAESIIVAVIIATIIEMLLPEGNSKKYIKVVIGVYVLFTIITPIINKFTGEKVDISDILDLDTYIAEVNASVKMQNTIQDNNQSSIMGMYSSGIKDDIKAKIEAKGYIVNDVDIDIADDESYIIERIVLDLEKEGKKEETDNNIDAKNSGNEENKVEEVEIVNKVEISLVSNAEEDKVENENNKKNELSNSEKNELKEYLSGVYEVDEDKITIN